MYFGKANRLLPFATFVEMEIKVIGKDDGVERRFVAVELLAVFLSSVEVAVFEIFGFDIGDRDILMQEREVGCAAVDMRLLVDDGEASACRQQSL